MVEHLSDLEGMRILLVDGDELVRNAIRFFLREQKSHVDAFETAEEALVAVEREHYELVLCDYYLQGMNGFEFFNELSKSGLDAVKVLVTDYAAPVPIPWACDAGIHGVIQKPLTSAALWSVLVGGFKRRERQRQRQRWGHMGTPGPLGMEGFVGTILNAMPLPVFVVDDDVKVLAANRAASQMLSKESKVIYRRRAGEVLHCVHSHEVAEGCGRAPSCGDCIVRNSVSAALRELKTISGKVKMEVAEEAKATKEIFVLVTATPFDYQGQKLVLLILQDISELTRLKSILPICSHCKKIRDDDRYWHSVEQYFKEHMDQDFTHGLCPECLRKHYPDYCHISQEPPLE